MTTNPISSAVANNNTRKITTKYKAAKYKAGMYSIVAAIVVLVVGATLSDSISILPVFLIGMVAIVCTGHRAVQYYTLHKILSRSISSSVSKATSSSMTSSKSNNHQSVPDS